LDDLAETTLESDLKATREKLPPKEAVRWPVFPEQRRGLFFPPYWAQSLKDELQRWQVAVSAMEAERSTAGKENRGAKPKYLRSTVRGLCEHFVRFYVPHGSNCTSDRINFIVTALESARIDHPDDERLQRNYIGPAMRAIRAARQEKGQK